MKNYLQKSNNSPLDFLGDAFDNFFKPIFYDEKFDSMKTDIKDTGNGYELEIEMPGFNKEDINISLEEGYLTVSAEKKEQQEESNKDRRFLRKERSVSCQRSFYVGDIKEDAVKAKYNNGVLELCLPKNEPEKPQKHSIDIE